MNEEQYLELLQSIREQFYLRGHWWVHKNNDGKHVEVGEDLNDLLHQVDEHLDTELKP